jgi:transcriptional regulator with XRE-family HTH domain
MRCRALTLEQLEEAKNLRQQGLTKRELAEYFGVGQTTIWENVFSQKKRIRVTIYANKGYSKIKHLVLFIAEKRNDGWDSKEVAELLEMNLEDVNYIWSHY